MGNSQITRDKIGRAVSTSLVIALRADLPIAWGSTVEVKRTHPEFDYDRRPLGGPGQDGKPATQARDLSAAPFVGVTLNSMTGRPYAIANRDALVSRDIILSVLALAPDDTSIQDLDSTLHSVLEGMLDGSTEFPLYDPDTEADTGRRARIVTIVPSGRFGPGDSFAGSSELIGHEQFNNLKFRTRFALQVEVDKRTGTSVA